MNSRQLSFSLVLLISIAAAELFSYRAEACGCLAPPDPTVPVVQAGERILFTSVDNTISAHIEVQYQGDAEEFAWLVPVPSEPALEVGTAELFDALVTATQPTYRVNNVLHGECGFAQSRGGGDSLGCGDAAEAGASVPVGEGANADAGVYDPLVRQDSVGPYDYAVLRADERQPMLDWLRDNSFFVPTGTDDAVSPYIREGSFFLALKLRSNQSAGDIQPIIVNYQSDYPLIPIVLTSVAADPDMPILVWVLGEHRAIPRNYYHTRINDARIDWLNQGANYVDVVTDAVDEADGHHSFVTEYAGTSNPMVGVLDPPGRFARQEDLAAVTSASQFLDTLFSRGYNYPLDSVLLAILNRELPIPQKLADEGVFADPWDYYESFDYYSGTFRDSRPELFEDADLTLDPVAAAFDIETRIVAPIHRTGQLFRDHPYLTRLFTTLSPDEMTIDPAFAFNPDLPEVSLVHNAELHVYCNKDPGKALSETASQLVTEDGHVITYPEGTGQNIALPQGIPSARLTQTLREEGAPNNITDNSNNIVAALSEFGDIPDRNAEGCRGTTVSPRHLKTLLFLACALLVIRRPRRNRRVQ